jgi:hypothetical protein
LYRPVIIIKDQWNLFENRKFTFLTLTTYKNGIYI